MLDLLTCRCSVNKTHVCQVCAHTHTLFKFYFVIFLIGLSILNKINMFTKSTRDVLYLLREKQQQGHVLIIRSYFSKWHGSPLSQSLVYFLLYVFLWYFAILIASYKLKFHILHHLSWAFLSYGMIMLCSGHCQGL